MLFVILRKIEKDNSSVWMWFNSTQ